MYKAFYSRYFVKDHEEFDTIEEAISFLKNGSAEGQLMQIAVLDKNNNIVWADGFYKKGQIEKEIKLHFDQ